MHDTRLLKDGTMVLKEGPIHSTLCESCGKPTTQLVVSGSYAEFLGVPMFPTGKSIKIRCTGCGHLVTEHTLSDAIKRLIKDLRKGVKYP